MINNLFQEPVLWKLLLITALGYLIWSGKIAIVFGSGGAKKSDREDIRTQASILTPLADASAEEKPKRPEVEVVLPPGALSNTTFAIDPAYAERNTVEAAEVQRRLAACRSYVERFAPVAQAEMEKFGIPASITLAQGLLESDAGESALARGSNNHFGIKCFSKRCKKGHCVNFTDDSHKDFFVKYSNVWGSYRAHSEMLRNSGRYRSLFNLPNTDYRGWARGLSKAGYATDKRYADKLIAIIQNLELERFDER